jgi:PAS domain S-box-containing protein
MGRDKGLPSGSAELRCLAEKRLRSESIATGPLLPNEELQRVIHELQVHQVELEMQNEELMQARNERDTMEAQLGKYTDLYDFAPVGYFNLDHEGVIRAVNLTGAGSLGIKRSLLIGRCLDLFISVETQRVFHDFLDKVFASEAKESCEVVFLKEKHRPFFVQVEAVVSESREECRAMVIDITERKLTEDALRAAQSEAELHGMELAALMDALPVAVLIAHDAECRLVSGSRVTQELLGLPATTNFYKSPLPSKRPTNFLLMKDGREIPVGQLPINLAARGEEVKNYDFDLVYEDGTVRTFLGDALPLYDKCARPCGAIGAFIDITERKRMEVALSDSEEMLRFFIEYAPAPLAMFDRDMRYLHASRRWLNDYGLGDSDLRGMSHYEIFPEIPLRWKEAHRKGLAGAVLREEADPFERADGSVQWVRWEIRPWYESAGNVGGIVIFSEDITEFKRMEERTAHLASFPQLNPTPIMEVDSSGKITFFNPATLKILETHGMGGADVADFLPPDMNGILESWDRINEATFYREIVIKESAFGEYIFLIPKLNVARVYAHDITARKLAEETLKKLNEELENRVAKRTEELADTIDNLQSEISERNKAEERVKRLNRLYLVLSETSKAIVRSKDRETLFSDFCRIAVEDGGFKLAWVGLVDTGSGELKVVAASGATCYLEENRITADNKLEGLGPTGISIREGTYYVCNDFLGSPITRLWHERGRAHGIHASACIALKQEGRVVGAFSLYADKKDFFDQQQIELLQQMGTDISFALDNIVREISRREAERALQEETAERLRAMEALREKEQMLIQQSRQAAMGEMIGNIAHQWRQPLNSLGLIIQHLLMFYDLGDLTRDYLEKSISQSMEIIHHMSRTIDDFRNYFRPDKEKTTFKVGEAIANTLTLIEDSFKSQYIEIEVVAKDDPAIYGYRNEFAQALLNILNNARDVLMERRTVSPKVTIIVSSEGERTVVTVKDNAGGIPEEIMEKIFDPYFSTKELQQGTGVGLFMSKTIIEKNMGGRLTARNAGDGAQFRIEI